MGKNSYNGGGTVVHAGSGFFSHKGGPGRRRKTIEGGDEPGEAKPGSICDFRSIRPKKKKVIEFQTKTKEQRSIEKRESEVKRLRSRAKLLIDKTAKAAQQVEQQIVMLRSALKKAEYEKTKLNTALLYAHGIDLQNDQLAGAVKRLNELFQGVSASTAVPTRKRKRKKLEIGAKKNHSTK
ncbi:hypothetical protein ASG42_24440 [Rhizobium sp. Leaf391]|uniref:hypothetical protein n=1 Tax=Rhizobium sp. Leaf391 TaxID=1736360 RepID=UPI0007130E9C|nr:hypothetical protein [Rhizobium sp. Leaf391]KQT03164.1 hypothetical protein ASG42_24440 [Rhizobium sp. Leaf391]